MAAQDLTTLANAKAWLGLASTADDALLTRLITSISVAIASYCSQNLVQQAYTDTYDGTGGSKMLLRQGPITAVASVTIDGVIIPARPAISQVGYYFDANFLYVDGYVFTRPGTWPSNPSIRGNSSGQGAQNVVVSYTAGYNPIPLDLEQATIELVAARFKARDRVGLKSKTMGGETMSYDLSALPQYVVDLLNQQFTRVMAG